MVPIFLDIYSLENGTDIFGFIEPCRRERYVLIYCAFKMGTICLNLLSLRKGRYVLIY